MVSAGNLENASLGLTLCAERAAIAVAAAAVGGLALRLRAVAVVSDRPGPFPPCGACRQVIAEFGPKAVIFYPGESGVVEASLGQLLPVSFQLTAGRT
jgi:cytidine deaminase